MSDVPNTPDGRSFPRLGSYQILRQLGSGGMSNVFQAIHEESGSIVALKVLPRKLAQNATLLQRFLREAKSAENLDHPNIVAIYDRGYDQGRHYLVLEFVEGRDLYDRVRLDGPLATPVAVDFIREVALGLQYASKLGMIHRDVKPANLLLTADGRAKIIDLGLALQAAEEDERVTRDGTTVGTVDYMSPEQARDSRKITERSDIYSLGCTLYFLMTGSPPFPGGNLADKLARHHGAAIPNVRDRVSEIPTEFARLIQKMMAKRPEDRYRNYQELIEALELIGKGSIESTGGGLADVLIDDDDDVVELTVALAEPERSDDREAKRPQVLDKSSAPEHSAANASRELSLADLAALDAEPAHSSKRKISSSILSTESPASRHGLDPTRDLEDEESATPLRRSRDELPLQTWIAAGILVGLVLAVVAFGVRFSISLVGSSTPKQGLSSPTEEIEEGSNNRGEANRTNDPDFAGTYIAAPKVNASPPALGVREPVRPVASGLVSTPEKLRRPSIINFKPNILARLGFDRHPQPTAPRDAKKVVVRRLSVPGETSQTSSLTVALARANEDVEIADAGPFHEDDYQIAGKSRVVRGKEGLRPILKIESSRPTSAREAEAKFVLGENGIESLVLEGLDLVVDVRDLPLTQTSLFICRGVDLTLRNCSITVANAEDRRSGFSVFRLETGPRLNRLSLHQCLVRGPIQNLVTFAGNRAEVLLDQSLIVGAGDPLFKIHLSDRSARSLRFDRSILATRGHLVFWDGGFSPTTIRSLGSTIAHVDPPSSAELFGVSGQANIDATRVIDYDGDYNHWAGWTSFGIWDSRSEVKSATNLPVRSDGIKPDASSTFAPGGWSAGVTRESIRADDLSDQSLVPSAMTDAIASPHPGLLAMTVDLFPKPTLPELLDDFATTALNPRGRERIELDFRAQPGSGQDLGQFLAAKIVDTNKRYLIRVSGSGSHYMTPVRLPDKSSVTLLGPRFSASSPTVPTFFASRVGSALIELRSGSLAIENLAFSVEPTRRIQHWLAVEDSTLALRRCSYRDQFADEQQAINYKATASRPSPFQSDGFQAEVDRPSASLKDCWIWTTGDGIVAEVARGVIQFENCLLVTGGTACTIKVGVTNLANLEADLIVENCTIFADKFVISALRSAGELTGVGRPWLILSRASVFPRSARDGGTLFGVGPDLLATGAFFWQSSKDLYEVGRFLGSNSLPQAAPMPSIDLKRHWIDLWGSVHTRDDRGPSARNSDRVIHFRDSTRSRTTRPTPGQLELDSTFHRSQGVNFKTLPPLPRS